MRGKGRGGAGGVFLIKQLEIVSHFLTLFFFIPSDQRMLGGLCAGLVGLLPADGTFDDCEPDAVRDAASALLINMLGREGALLRPLADVLMRAGQRSAMSRTTVLTLQLLYRILAALGVSARDSVSDFIDRAFSDSQGIQGRLANLGNLIESLATMSINPNVTISLLSVNLFRKIVELRSTSALRKPLFALLGSERLNLKRSLFALLTRVGQSSRAVLLMLIFSFILFLSLSL